MSFRIQSSHSVCSFVPPPPPPPPPSANTLLVYELMSGTVGGVASIVVCHPLDTIRVRMQTGEAGRFKGVADCVRQTAINEGNEWNDTYTCVCKTKMSSIDS